MKSIVQTDLPITVNAPTELNVKLEPTDAYGPSLVLNVPGKGQYVAVTLTPEEANQLGNHLIVMGAMHSMRLAQEELAKKDSANGILVPAGSRLTPKG